MKKVCVFLAPGFEECEALLVVDLLRRAGLEVTTAGLGGRTITSSHAVAVQADALIQDVLNQEFDLLVLPGGMPGTLNLKASSEVSHAVQAQYQAGRRLAAICAAPSVLGGLGLLQGRKAVCYPGFEPQLEGAQVCTQPVVTDGTITTANGLGAAIPFALELIGLLIDPETAQKVAGAIGWNH